MEDKKHPSRRTFIQQTAMAGTGLMFAGPIQLFSQTTKIETMSKNIKTKGYAGHDTAGKVTPWNFERRAVGDDDILIDIKFSGICHSDIHTIK